MLTTRESFSLNADIRDAANNQKVMLHATYSTTSLSLNLDVLDADLCAGNSEDVQADVQAFLLEACKRAAVWGFRAKLKREA
ncbi:MAG: hypothetical protein ACLS7Z_02985 [Christensenellales bacterium]